MTQEEMVQFIKWVGRQVDLFKSEDEECYACIDVNGSKRVHRINDIEYADYLRLKFTEKYGKIVSNQGIKEVQAHQAAVARQSGKNEQVNKRFARADDAVYVDLCDSSWRVVKIDRDGVRVLTKAKVHFTRSAGQKPLPKPNRKSKGRGFKALRKLLHNMSHTDFKLTVCWLVSAIMSRGPYPIMVLQGEQGSAKSSTMQLCKNIVDPFKAPIRSLPKNEQDLVIMAQGNAVLAFDNISKIKGDMGNAFCRMATGAGIGQRKLYTDGEEVFFEACRPTIFNGITDFITQNDLADRVVIITLNRIAPEDYRTVSELTATIELEMPYILGDLYAAIHVAMNNYDEITEKFSSRMADFERISCAVAPAINWSSEKFKLAYEGNKKRLSTTCFESDQIAMLVHDYITDEANESRWEGTVSEFRKELILYKSELENDKYFPKAPNKLSGRIREASPALREKGVIVKFISKRNKRIMIIDYQFDSD